MGVPRMYRRSDIKGYRYMLHCTSMEFYEHESLPPPQKKSVQWSHLTAFYTDITNIHSITKSMSKTHPRHFFQLSFLAEL